MPHGQLLNLLAVTALVLGPASIARAQHQQLTDPPDDALLRIGPVAFVPSINLSNLGYDSNIYGRDLSQGEQSDMTAKLTPSVSVYMGSPRLKANASGALTFNYFKDNTDLRSTDSSAAFVVEVPLNRLTPYVSGSYTSTQQPNSNEIDTIARSMSRIGTAGLNVDITPSLRAGFYFQNERLEFGDDNQLYFGVDLARSLNHSSDRYGLLVQYRLTPFTTVGVDLSRQEDEFDYAIASNSENFEVMPYVEFSPSAVIGGRASFGVQQRRYNAQALGESTGTVAEVNLNYTLLGHTRFGVDVHRELEYSYLALARQYLSTEVDVSVLHRFNDAWDAMVTVGRASIGYRESVPTGIPVITLPDEEIRIADGSIGYRLEKTRTGFTVEYRGRIADSFGGVRSSRYVYRRLRVGVNVSHEF